MKNAASDTVEPGPRARPSNSNALVLDWDFHRRRPDLAVRPIHHLHGDLGDTRTSFLRDQHGAVKAVTLATSRHPSLPPPASRWRRRAEWSRYRAGPIDTSPARNGSGTSLFHKACSP